MQFLMGLVSGLAFFSLIGGAYMLGAKRGKPARSRPEPLNEEEKRRAAQIRKDFSEIMGYDMDKARGGTT